MCAELGDMRGAFVHIRGDRGVMPPRAAALSTGGGELRLRRTVALSTGGRCSGGALALNTERGGGAAAISLSTGGGGIGATTPQRGCVEYRGATVARRGV